MEGKRLFVHTLKFWKERGNNLWVVEASVDLSNANRLLNFPEEEIPQAKEALEIYEWFNRILGRSQSLQTRCHHRRSCIPSDRFLVCKGGRVLGDICHSRDKADKAISHLEMALRVASSSNWYYQLFWIDYTWRSYFPSKAYLTGARSHRTCQVGHDQYCTLPKPRDVAGGGVLVSATQVSRGNLRRFACCCCVREAWDYGRGGGL